MTVDAKVGALTQADIQAIWVGAVDKYYSEPLIAAGDGDGFEVYSQVFAQLARAAQAIDTSTQAMYIRAWSGQTGAPAPGANVAVVQLFFTRTKRLELPLVLAKGVTVVLEQSTDWGIPGGVTIQSGRRYVLDDTLVFQPGESGPLSVTAVSDRPGWGFNNPLPGSLQVVEQLGTGFFHDRATVQTFPAPPGAQLQVTLTTVNEADTFIPEHVGQYVLLTVGANAGQIARMVSFTPPNLVPVIPVGSAVQLEVTISIEAFGGIAGTFQAGETALFTLGLATTATVRILGEEVVGSHKRVTAVLLTGTPAIGNTLTGQLSGATATFNLLLNQVALINEAPFGGIGGASWRVLDWAFDLGLTVTNLLKPAGGTLGLLDELGEERNLPRGNGETDAQYRARVGEIADVVTPNAIRRTAQRVLGSFPYCFREVGSALLPGFFYDGDLEPINAAPHGGVNDAWDYEVLVWSGVVSSGAFFVDGLGFAAPFQERLEHRDSMGNVKSTGYFGRMRAGPTRLTMIRKSGTGVLAAGDVIVGLSSHAVFTPAALVTDPTNLRRFRYWLDYVEFRAFFLIGVPNVAFDEFGFAYDSYPTGAYDAYPWLDFYDGFPAGNVSFYGRLYDAISAVKAGGVGFTLVREVTPGVCL